MGERVIFENEFCRVCIDSMTGSEILTLEVLGRYEQDLNMIAVDANSKFAKAVIGMTMDKHSVEQKMKTIIDVVNEFRGVWIGTGCTAFAIGETIHYGDTFTERTICSRSEFDKCVAEMSSGLFVPLANKSSEPEIQYDSDGNGYQVGAIYEFSDDGESWAVDRFDGLNEGHTYYKFWGDDCSWKYIRECKSPIGKIHKKTAELIDGEVYRFEASSGRYCGFYSESGERFLLSPDGLYVLRRDAFNITRLVPEKNQWQNKFEKTLQKGRNIFK